jgi:serine/threonine-protein kinase
MGEVLLGYDERLDRRVAIKRVLDGRLTPRLRERFRLEARAAARLSHPAIVQVYDLLEDESGDCIVLEYAAGRTLREMLEEGPLDVSEAVRLGGEIAGGLAAAHEAGIVHRDLKAENVIVTPAGHAKILDFGLAKPFAADLGTESLTEHGTVVGTSHAMSPEQAGGDEVDGRSDLFSFGVLLYEMLTGKSPFRGVHALDTLRRVLTEEPPPPSALRPGLPPALDALVMGLLAKDRENRPASAAAVGRVLEEIGRLPLSGIAAPVAWGLGDGERFSELPTGEVSPPDYSPLKSDSSDAALVAREFIPGRGRRTGITLAILLLFLLLALGAWLLLRPAVPLRIAVAPPEVAASGDPEALGLVSSGLLGSLLGSLAGFDGLAPLDPSQLGDLQARPSPVATARTAAADEVLTSRVERTAGAGGLYRVSLRRIAGGDGQVLWAKTFDVPAGPGDLRLMDDAVRAQVRQAWPDHPPRPGVPELEVRDEDYAAYLAIKRRIDVGATPLEPELPRLEALLKTSPRFLEAALQAAKVAYSLSQSTRDPAYLDRAARLLDETERMAPGDPRPLGYRFRLALARGRENEAEAALARLARLAPGDAEEPLLRARLAEQRGDVDGALDALRAAARRAPSWRVLFALADLEYRNGEIAPARRHLETLLERSPDNLWGLQKLAEVELMAGDLDRAERIYRGLVQRAPLRSNYTNLGLARFLNGRADEAVAAYRKALEIDPGHVTVTINLADAELSRGRLEEARALYAQALAALDASSAASTLGPQDRMLQAQCLAHLGRTREAVKLAESTLRQNPNNPEVLYLGSLVYGLTGERMSSLINAESALAHGVQPRWFSIHPLRNDPEMRALLQGR